MHPEEMPKDLNSSAVHEIYMCQVLHYSYVYLEFQNGVINKGGSNTSKYRLCRYVYASLMAQSRKVHLPVNITNVYKRL